MSQGRHWIDQLNKELEPKKVNIITDVRFNEFEKDEVFWVKNEINAVLIHISRFIEKDGMREFVSPANPAESENDPKVKAEADFILNWATENDEVKRIFNCKKLLKWLQGIYAKGQST
jgi:pyoverdine/dityrosine biosynthesis protein Dit1